jgi:hypothetical protein
LDGQKKCAEVQTILSVNLKIISEFRIVVS